MTAHTFTTHAIALAAGLLVGRYLYRAVRARLPEWMDRHRGRRGLRGWLVFRADVRYMRRVARVARRIARREARR